MNIVLIIIVIFVLVKLFGNSPEKEKEREEARRKEEEARRKEEEAQRKEEEAQRKEELRKNTPCTFSDGLSFEDFTNIAIKESKRIKRLSITVNGPIIYGTVIAQSGITDWYFKVDFNDFGHITGNYWLSRENYDSAIPKAFANNLSKAIEDYISEIESKQNKEEHRNYCSFCGKPINDSEDIFCIYCGKKLK